MTRGTHAHSSDPPYWPPGARLCSPSRGAAAASQTVRAGLQASSLFLSRIEIPLGPAHSPMKLLVRLQPVREAALGMHTSQQFCCACSYCCRKRDYREKRKERSPSLLIPLSLPLQLHSVLTIIADIPAGPGRMD